MNRMLRSLYNHLAAVVLTALAISMWNCTPAGREFNGLIGIYYSESNLTSPKGLHILDSLTQIWDESVDFQSGSSAEWKGYLKGPVSGDVKITVTTTTRVSFQINGMLVEAHPGVAGTSSTVTMKKGSEYPVVLLFYYERSAPETGAFEITWEWEGQGRSLIGGKEIYHTEKETEALKWFEALDMDDFDPSEYLKAVDPTHTVVYYEPGGFGAWPANNGIWSWGDEILVGFTKGTFRKNEYHHSLDQTKPNSTAFARSLDGGLTWNMEEDVVLPRNGIRSPDYPVNFTHPDFALRNQNDFFNVSYDRGNSWSGPFRYPDFKIGELSSRTDYIVEDKNSCNFFLSAKYLGDKDDTQDRSFLARTTDGGLSFDFVSWITETDTLRSVMSSTVKAADTHYIAALRRRYDAPRGVNHTLRDNWIDVYESKNGGGTWSYLSKIADTDKGRRNGNPPSLVRLSHGLLCVSYGYRGIPYSIRARTSRNNGRTWSKEIIVRDDASKWDLGYLRSVVLPDDRIVLVYYFTSHDVEEQHIQATIWDPRKTAPY